MTKTKVIEDIAYARSIAEQGARTPLLGSSISLMWGLMVIPTLILHGLTLMGKFPLSPQNIGVLWGVYGAIGTFGSIYLGRKIDKQPGAKSQINQVGEVLGIGMGILMATFAITTVFMVVSKGLPGFLYNMIIVFAFSLITLNLAVLARLTGHTYMKIVALCSGAITVITYMLVQSPNIYFFAAFGVIITQIIPSLIGLKKETANV